MPKRITRLSRSRQNLHHDQHRYEHWLIDNQIYFLTAKCRDGFAAFTTGEAKHIFWQKFEQYATEFGFTPWVISLLNNHYHALGHLAVGENLPKMMQRIHGSVAKLVNDVLPQQYSEFWRNTKGHEYFDGCIRDERQGRLAFWYTARQGQRHGIVGEEEVYAHTRVYGDVESAIRGAKENKAFLEGVPYKRYMR